jgi:hypothetical protein
MMCFIGETLKDPAAVFTFALAVIGVLQAGLFAIQLWFMRKSLKDTAAGVLEAIEANKNSQKNFAADQRPWILISEPKIGMQDEEIVVFSAKAKNIGKSPAFNVETRIEVRRRKIAIASVAAVEEFVSATPEPGYRAERQIVLPNQELVVHSVGGADSASNDYYGIFFDLRFCVTYEAGGLDGPRRVAGEVIFTSGDIQEPDEEGICGVKLLPHDFSVTFAD